MDFSVCMTCTFLEVCAYENIRTRHKRSHLYAEMMAKMALRRYELLAGDQWWPFFVTFYFLVTDILCLVIQYFGSIN